MNRTAKLRMALLVAVALTVTGIASAFINPEFTPIDVVEQSELILRIRVNLAKDKPQLVLEVQECLKGDAPDKTVTVNLEGAWNQEHIEALKHIVAAVGDEFAILFAGTLEGQQDVGLLHIGGNWFRVVAGEDDNTWELEGLDTQLEGTWAGGTDMLIRAVGYILTDPYPLVPVSVGTAWEEASKLGSITGKVGVLQAVDLAGDGKLCLFVGSEGGDRLFRYNGESGAFEDITAGLNLQSKSVAGDWADFDADGRLDLASLEGGTLNLWLQAEDGTFNRHTPKVTGVLPPDTTGICALAVNAKGQAGLLIGNRSAPVLLMGDGEDGFKAVGLSAPGEVLKELGEPGRCLVADFDGDALPDILQPYTNGGVLYQGKGPGVFAVGGRCDVALGKGPAGAFLGDFDADGMLDVFAASEEGKELWHNKGGGVFTRTAQVSGEVAYIARPGGIGGSVCDINTDGRQDLLIGYANDFPQVFFNRCFRSFGFAFQLNLDEMLPDANQGQQAVAAADLNGDGAHDVVLVLKSGDIYVLTGQSAMGEVLCARVELEPKSGGAGPVTVTGWVEGFCLGAWNVTRSGPGAHFGMFEAGPCKLKWRFPQGKMQEKEILVEDKSVRFLMAP